MTLAVARKLRDLVKEIEPGPLLHNPYLPKHDGELDVDGAALVRRHNLVNYVTGIRHRPKLMLVGEAFGSWGGRWSGAAFTSESQMVRKELPFQGQRTSLLPKPARESSATIMWGILGGRWRDAAMWNSLMLLPMRRGEPLSMRAPTTAEVQRYAWVLQAAVEAVKPQGVVAVGRCAEKALRLVGVEHVGIRHPARGGAAACRQQLGALLGERPSLPEVRPGSPKSIPRSPQKHGNYRKTEQALN